MRGGVIDLGRRLVAALWPRFSRASRETTPYQTFVSYRRVWYTTVLVLATASVAPLIVLTTIHKQLTNRAIHNERVLRTVRLASNARRSVAHFLEERLDALEFTIRELSQERIRDSRQLATVLENLKFGFGGFSDLGVIDASGIQVAYSGPYDLVGRNYSGHEWFEQCMSNGTFVSDVFRGYRDVPHIVIAVRSEPGEQPTHLLRATIETGRLADMVDTFKQAAHDDVFLINRRGVIQSPSRCYGDVLEQADLEVPAYSEHTQSVQIRDPEGEPALVGYAYISTKNGDTPFVLMLVRREAEMMESLSGTGFGGLPFLTLSIIGISLIVIIMSTYMINRLYDADRAKAETMVGLEEAGRLASLGRLAAGVAHEINNPLAVINEEVGYMRDVLALGDTSEPACFDSDAGHGGFKEFLDSILDCVERCGAITRQLLSFARQIDVSVEPVCVAKVAEEILGFHRKEAGYRGIDIRLDAPRENLEIVTDRGQLQQVLFNLVNNAIQAMTTGGVLEVAIRPAAAGGVQIAVRDTGCGIPEEHLGKIFEPFFTTKGRGAGTGLGLSITYGLVRKLRGGITVESQVGAGTTFTVVLPERAAEASTHESTASR